eukprot:767210-Hanusia_phi.AAC.3
MARQFIFICQGTVVLRLEGKWGKRSSVGRVGYDCTALKGWGDHRVREYGQGLETHGEGGSS